MRLKVKDLVLLNWQQLLLLLLLKKTDQETKIRDISKKITDDNHDEYISNPEFDEFHAEVYAVRLRPANLESKNDISNFAKKKDFGSKLLSFSKIIKL